MMIGGKWSMGVNRNLVKYDAEFLLKYIQMQTPSIVVVNK